jgi:acetyl-CoA carboxylase biotin carboxyl carrier protein
VTKARADAVSPQLATGNNKVATTMTQIDSERVRQLAEILNDTGLTEIEYEADGLRVRVARAAHHVVHAPIMPTGALAAPLAAQGPAQPAAEPSSHPGAVKAPMVGVAYLTPEPGAPAFIKVGDQVSEGQTVVLIEAMKTFNPVKAPRAGKITRILIENGAPVEYGEALVIIE